MNFTRPWVAEIILAMRDGAQGFNKMLSTIPARMPEFGGSVKISDRVLTERLREMESHGMVSRDVTVVPGKSVRVRYALTAKAQPYVPVLAALQALENGEEAKAI